MTDFLRVQSYNNGHKRVAFSKTNQVREVGSIFQQATVQYCYPGDWIAQSDGSFFIVGHDLKVIRTEIPRPLPDWVKMWFKMPMHQLPVGQGWDGESTIASRRRDEKIKTLLFGLHHDILKKIQSYAKVTPAKQMVLTWKLAEPLPIRVIDGHLSSLDRPRGCDNLSWGYIHWGTGRAKWAGAFESIPFKNQGIFYAACHSNEGNGRIEKSCDLRLFKGVLK